MPVSAAESFFEGQAFKAWKKARESEVKMQADIVGRLNEVIRACGAVAKTIARRPTGV